MSDSDDIYRSALARVKPFEFNETVTRVFDDMIRRSVPGYAQVLELLPTLMRQLANGMPTPQRSFRFYDLGCSLGAGLRAIARGVDTPEQVEFYAAHKAEFIGVDLSAPMIAQAKKLLEPWFSTHKLKLALHQQDLLSYSLQPTDLVLMNFTLQFIELGKRPELIARIYKALQPGGYLVLSEKIRFDDTEVDQAMTRIHHQFKADQGYSELEISQKRDAIENVLVPETVATHVERLQNAGFKVVTSWLQNFQFVSFLAIK